MFIYLDESGDLGFNFTLTKTSRYLVITCLVCPTLESIQVVKRAIKLTLKNKLAAGIIEVKGSNTSLAIKNYFFNHIQKNKDWKIMTITVDKKAWLKYQTKSPAALNKNLFYDDVAKHLLSQIDLPIISSHIQLVVDKSKTQSALKNFDQSISAMVNTMTSNKTSLAIYHRNSLADPGLQATDMFGWGVYRKYQYGDIVWYDIFKKHIVVEIAFKF